MSKTYKVKDVAAATGINSNTVSTWLKDNKFPSSRAANGRTYLLDEKTYEKVCSYAKTRVKNNNSPNRKSITIKNDIKSTGPARKWATVQDQIEATLAGEITPIYLDRQGDVIDGPNKVRTNG